jgi:DNA-binding CsgD family transcriptional regulator
LTNIYNKNWGISPLIISEPQELKGFLGRNALTVVCDETFYDTVKELTNSHKNCDCRIILISEWLQNEIPAGGATIGPETQRQEVLQILEPERDNHGRSNLLSKRETEVLRMVATGFSNKEISSKLFVSIHTVISHRKNITEKLGIKTISGLSLYAFLNGMISYDDFPGPIDSR